MTTSIYTSLTQIPKLLVQHRSPEFNKRPPEFNKRLPEFNKRSPEFNKRSPAIRFG